MKFSKQEYCSGLPFPSPGGLPNPGIDPRSPALHADSSLSEPPGKPHLKYKSVYVLIPKGCIFPWASSSIKEKSWRRDHPPPPPPPGFPSAIKGLYLIKASLIHSAAQQGLLAEHPQGWKPVHWFLGPSVLFFSCEDSFSHWVQCGFSWAAMNGPSPSSWAV